MTRTGRVGNAVRDGVPSGGEGRLVLRVRGDSGCLRVEVDDASPDLPGRTSDPGPGAESGRGLLLVEELASAWGAAPLAGGRRVWFEITAAPEQA